MIRLSIVALAILGLSSWLTACGEGGASTGRGARSEGPKSVSVELVVVEPAEMRWEVGLTGQINAEYLVNIAPEIKGVIRTIEFEEGKPVAKGDVLFILRDEEQKARLSEARASKNLAQDIFDRTQRLASEDISSIARGAESRSRLDEAQAHMDLAQLQVSRTRVRAPFDGVMGATEVGPGAWVEPERGLATIAAIDTVQVPFTTTEQGSSVARLGAEVTIRVVAYPEEKFVGEVFFISPTIDPATRRLIMKARIDNADHRLKPGMFANVDVVVAIKPNAIVLPEAAMVYDRNGTYVWRVGAEGLAEKIPVRIGLRQNGMVEVIEGLRGGDRIVSAGVHKVMAGYKLESADPVAAVSDESALRDGGSRAEG